MVIFEKSTFIYNEKKNRNMGYGTFYFKLFYNFYSNFKALITIIDINNKIVLLFGQREYNH